MLSLLDRYIMKKYFTTFFFSALLFTIIALVIDFSERIQRFIDADLSAGKVIREYYLNFIPWINSLLWPLFALMAVVFFTSRMAKNSEIVATLSAGVSFRRLTVPYLLASLVLGLIHFAGNHYFIPRGNKTFITFENTYIKPGNIRIKGNDVHIFLDPESKIFVRSYRKSDTTARGVFLERFAGNELRYFLKADHMSWVGPPSTWRLKDYEIRQLDGDKETFIVGRGKTLDTTFNLLPGDFTRYINQKEMMTTAEMREYIAYEKSKGLGTAKSMSVELHRRSADPYTMIVLTIIGLAVAARKVRGGIGLHLALGITIGALYIILSRFSITFASKLDLPAGISVWLPNIGFTVVAIYLLFRAQR